jgi:hypothetical protein
MSGVALIKGLSGKLRYLLGGRLWQPRHQERQQEKLHGSYAHATNGVADRASHKNEGGCRFESVRPSSTGRLTIYGVQIHAKPPLGQRLRQLEQKRTEH